MMQTVAKRLVVGFVLAAAFAGTLAHAQIASQKGPAKPKTVTICHYNLLLGTYKTMTMNATAAATHLASHSKDYAGACK